MQEINKIEEIVRVYVNTEDEQFSGYFENTPENIANFIFRYAAKDREILVENIFGKPIVRMYGADGQLEGRQSCISAVETVLFKLQNGEETASEIGFLALENINGRDEFDSRDIDSRSFEKLL